MDLLKIAHVCLPVVILNLLFCPLVILADDQALTVDNGSKIDFGKYPANERREAKFIVRNTGNITIKIVKELTTCGCSEVRCTPMTIDAGKTAEVTALILPYSVYGAYEKSIYLHTDRKGSELLTMTMKGDARPLVNILPQNIVYAGWLSLNKQWKQDFTIESVQAGVKLGTPKLTSNYPIQMEFLDNNDKTIPLTLSLTPTENLGDLKCSVTIPVLEPAGWNPVEIMVAGKVGKALECIPATVYLPKSAVEPVKRRLFLKIIGEDLEKIKTSELKVSITPGMTCKIHDRQGSRFPLDLTFSPEFASDANGTKELTVTALDGLSVKINLIRQ